MSAEPDATVTGAAPHVAILGAGLMGAQIGCEYALGGCAVTWLVRDRQRASERVERALAVALQYELADEPALARARAAMRYEETGVAGDGAPGAGEAGDAGDADARHSGAPGAAGEPALIVESLPEDLATKVDALAPHTARWPRATVASNTSSISISALGEAAGVAERIVGTHYWNPPLLMPLVETIAGERTPRARLDAAIELLRAIGKRPVVLEREAQGLLWNRLQLAVLRECLWLVEHGVASPATIDEVMRDGLARRWRLTGPFETVGLGGAATFDAIAANLFPVLSDARAGAGFDAYVPHDRDALAALRERRDEALAAELRDERVRYTD